jgi:hypothetical protein
LQRTGKEFEGAIALVLGIQYVLNALHSASGICFCVERIVSEQNRDSVRRMTPECGSAQLEGYSCTRNLNSGITMMQTFPRSVNGQKLEHGQVFVCPKAAYVIGPGVQEKLSG